MAGLEPTLRFRENGEKHAELEAQMVEAGEQARQKALAGIKAVGEAGDWRAWEAFLRMSFPADYRHGNNVNINATATAAGQQTMLVCDEAMRARLIALRERILAETTSTAPRSE